MHRRYWRVVFILIFTLAVILLPNSSVIGTTPLPIPLRLPTYDSSGQTVHPDIVYIKEGFGAEKWTYWLAFTPYPGGDASKENPSILVSMDGINWQEPAGIKNPLIAKPPGTSSHNSDPDILYHQGQLILYYRESIIGKETLVSLYRITSTNGIQWSAPQRIMSSYGGGSLLSPAVWHDGEQYNMLYVNDNDGERLLYKTTSADGINWLDAWPVNISGLPADRSPWHINVLVDDGVLHCLLVSVTGGGGLGSRLHYAHSNDNGENWLAQTSFLFPLYLYDITLQYRATMLPATTGNHFRIWYSARTRTGIWGTIYVDELPLP